MKKHLQKHRCRKYKCLWTLGLEINTRAGCGGWVASWGSQGFHLLAQQRQGELQPQDLVPTDLQAACELLGAAEAHSYTVFLHPNPPQPCVAELPCRQVRVGCLWPAQAAAQCQQSFLTHCVLGMEGCCGTWVLFATKKIQIRVRIYTFFEMSPFPAVLPTGDFQKTGQGSRFDQRCQC